MNRFRLAAVALLISSGPLFASDVFVGFHAHHESAAAPAYQRQAQNFDFDGVRCTARTLPASHVGETRKSVDCQE